LRVTSRGLGDVYKRQPKGREDQLIHLAVQLAEKQLREGTASAQVISHYLKMGSQREQLEQERLRGENALLVAKVDQLNSQQNMESLYKEAMDAMRSYSGKPPISEPSDDDY
jgi:hypothetical protein